MSGRLMIYGATGYTGKLMAEEAVAQGITPILAGRDPDKVAALAARLGLSETRCFPVDDATEVARGLEGVSCVIHAAGPFTITGPAMIEACIATGAHYLDITGEFSIFSLAESLSNRAAEAGVMLMPGVGWDVVPSDGVAAHAAARVGDPQSLRVWLNHFGGISRGSARSGEYINGTGPKARRDGIIVTPDDQEPQTYDFGHGPKTCYPMPMGDIITSWKSARVPNVDIYFAEGDGPPFDPAAVDSLPEGPSKEERDAGLSRAIAEVTGADGYTAISMIETVSGYGYTAISAVAIAKRVLEGDFTPGFQSPVSAYGVDFTTGIGGSKVSILA